MTREPLATALRVLWVDDDHDLIRDLADYLGGKGIAVDCAGNLAEAAQQLDKVSYDLALVDLDLPDGSGGTSPSSIRLPDETGGTGGTGKSADARQSRPRWRHPVRQSGASTCRF